MADLAPSSLITLLEIRARTNGGSQVLMALDRLACPLPGVRNALRIKQAAEVVKAWVSGFPPEQRKMVGGLIGEYMKQSMAVFRNQEPTNG